MPDPLCLATHPDDQPPIMRTCRRPPRHEPPHRDHPDGTSYRGPIDEWEDE